MIKTFPPLFTYTILLAFLNSCAVLVPPPKDQNMENMTQVQVKNSSGNQNVFTADVRVPLFDYNYRPESFSMGVGAGAEFFSPKIGNLRIDYNRKLFNDYLFTEKDDYDFNLQPGFSKLEFNTYYSYPIFQTKVNSNVTYHFRPSNLTQGLYLARVPSDIFLNFSLRAGVHKVHGYSPTTSYTKYVRANYNNVDFDYLEEQYMEQSSTIVTLGFSMQPFINSTLTGTSSKGDIEAHVQFISNLYLDVQFLVGHQANINAIPFRHYPDPNPYSSSERTTLLMDFSEYLDPTRVGFTLGYRMQDLGKGMCNNLTLEIGRVVGYYEKSNYANFFNLRYGIGIGKIISK